MDKQPLRHILNSQPSSEHRVSSKVLSIEGYYSINIFTPNLLLFASAAPDDRCLIVKDICTYSRCLIEKR